MLAWFASRGGAPRSPHAETGGQEGGIGARNFALDDFRGLTVEEAGELIRHEPVEHAVIFGRAGRALYYRRSWPGDPYRVTIPIGKSGLIRGNVFVHNHPRSESFSARDIWILLRYGAREVRAFGPERAFRIASGSSTRSFGFLEEALGWREVDAAYERIAASLDGRHTPLVRTGRLTPTQAWAAQTHAVVRRMAMRYGFLYQEV